MKYANGVSYEGEWKDNNRHGQGIMKYANGNSYQGEWKDGKQHGLGRQTYSGCEYKEGQWETGKQVGEHKNYSKEGNLLELITYENGNEVKREKVE
ncbi:hypothetical protein FGO68_gene10159 [Halteria grandinella]|uniref:MORN repeat protein n=1 Tax=Halteria grandinella TaxID=5974 RepID=A0A8J8NSY6_HALGN|nr:hypothetical protein FGO68_gene10159 [Halteria grandinella]